MEVSGDGCVDYHAGLRQTAFLCMFLGWRNGFCKDLPTPLFITFLILFNPVANYTTLYM